MLIKPFGSYREAVSARLLALPPAGFERFCQRLLRESGFEEVRVTGGPATVASMAWDSSGQPARELQGALSVQAIRGLGEPSQVRDFRGAMIGRADKGIIITTGSFTSDARKEAVRDGAPPIELVDGEKLVEMLEQAELGLRPRRTFEVDATFFDQFGK